MTYDVRGRTVIGASFSDTWPEDWISTIFVSNLTGRATMRVTVLADEKTRLGKFELYPETGAQIVCDRPVSIITGTPGTKTPCDFEHGIPAYDVAWYYADPARPGLEKIYENDGMYYYSQAYPVSLKGTTYDWKSQPSGTYDYTVPHTSFVVMDNGKATPEWEGGDYYGCTNECYGTTKKYQIAYLLHPTTGVYTTDPDYYFPDGTTNRTVSIGTGRTDRAFDMETFKGFNYCYMPAKAEKVTDTPVPLIPVDAALLAVSNATLTINGFQVEGKEGMVLSNGTYTVTYTATGDYCLTGGKTVLTYDLDTAVNPVTLKGGEKPPEAYIPVAKIEGGIGYATLQAALDAAEDGDTVTLCQDSTEAVTVSKSLTLDLGTHTLKAAEGTTVTVASGKTLTLAGETGATIGKVAGTVQSQSKEIVVDGDQGWAGTKAPYTLKDYITVNTSDFDVENTTWKITMDGQTVTTNAAGVYRVFKDWPATVAYTAKAGYCFENTATTWDAELDTAKVPAEMVPGDKPNAAIYAIATMGGKAYETAQAAVDAAVTKSTVTLVNDTTETVTLAADKTITLDLNGHTLSELDVTTGTVELTGGEGSAITSVHVALPGSVTSASKPTVAAPEGYEWFYNGAIYTLVKTTEPYTGDVTINEDIVKDATWVMTLDNANITVEKVAGTDALAAITNNLAGITGTGKILLNAPDKDYRKVLRDLVAKDADVTIDCVTVSATDDGQGNLKAVVEEAVEDPEAETTVVAAMKTEGDVYIEVKADATKDVVVNEGAETSKDMTIINKSTQALTIPEAKAENVTIKNYGHLESDTTANLDLSIINGSANTLVGTYKAGGDIEVTGQYGSLSNVVIDATGTLTLKRQNIVSGPVTLKADSFDVSDNTLLFSAANNNTTLDIDFAQVKGSAAFGVIVDKSMASGDYTLASNAADADGKTFTLLDASYTKITNITVNASNNPVWNGGAYALTNDVDVLKLTVDANYVSNALVTAKAMVDACRAEVESMRVLQEFRDSADFMFFDDEWGVYPDTTRAILYSEDTKHVNDNLDGLGANLAAILGYAREYEASMPTDVTIDATLENPDGKNTFNTLDAAFSAGTTSCATNLIFKDRFTTLSENVPVDKTPDPATNWLQKITFAGDSSSRYLIIHEEHVNTKGESDAKPLAAALQALVAEDADIKVLTGPRRLVGNNNWLEEDTAALEVIALTNTIIAADVELIAPTTALSGKLTWDVSYDVTLLRDFDGITEVINVTNRVEVGYVTPSTGVTNRTLATKATKLADETFTFVTDTDYYASLTVGSESNVVYNSMVYTLAMNGTDLVLTMDGDYVSAKLAAVDTQVTNAIAQVNAMRLTPSERALATAYLDQNYTHLTNGVAAAKNKAEVAALIVWANDNITNVLAEAAELESTKPGDITVDATIEADGTNSFNTLDAAFKNDLFMPCATNLIIKGNVGLSADVLASPATNCLTMISGEGIIVIDEKHVDAAGNNDVEALTAFFNSIAGEGVAITTAPAVVSVTGGEFATETNVVAASVIALSRTTTIKANVAFTAPKVTNDGQLRWDISDVNTNATLFGFDSIAPTKSASYAVHLDENQISGESENDFGSYTLATDAASATNLTFTLTGFSPAPKTLNVGATNTIYVGAKAFTLTVNEAGSLVFTIAWGKFAITYNAAGGTWTTDASTATNIDAYVNKGYDFPTTDPTRAGYSFNGWYRSWTNNAEQVTAQDTSASPVVPLKEHTLYAQWTRLATTDAHISDMKGTDDPRTEITVADGFRGSRTLTTLAMPLYVTKIGAQAFRGASSLKSIHFVQPHSYTDFSELPLEIEDYAFMGCSLEEIVIPAYVTKIGQRAFNGCNYLKKITLLGTPEGMTVKAQPFNLCGTKATDGLTISLAPAAATNTQFVADLTNGCTSVIKLAQQLDGEIAETAVSKDFSATTDEVTLTITYTGTGIVNERSVSALYGLTVDDLVKKPTCLVPTSVVSNGNGTYTCVFHTGNVGAQVGFFRVCIGESF